MFRFTIFDRIEGFKPSAKEFHLQDGQLVKSDNPRPYGPDTAYTVECSSLREFASSYLEEATPYQSFCYGTHKDDLSEYIVCAESDDRYNKLPSAYFKTIETLVYKNEPTILTFDYDGFQTTAQDAVRSMRKVFPFLKDHSSILMPSSSANIYKDGADEPIFGLTGLHEYFLLDDGSQTKRVGDVIIDRLILEGHGIPYVKGTTFQVRTIVDPMVCQSNRGDYVGGPILPPGYHQHRPVTYRDGKQGDVMSSYDFIPLNRMERMRLESVKAGIKRTVQHQLDQNRQAAIDAAKSARERQNLIAMIDYAVLRPGYILRTRDGRGIDVGDIIDNPRAYQNMQFLDPDTNAKGKTKLFVNNEKSIILHCFDKGGRKFKLMPEFADYKTSTNTVVKKSGKSRIIFD